MIKNDVLDITDLQVEVAELDDRCMIRVDTYSLVLAIGFVIECLEHMCQLNCNLLRLAAPGNLVQLDLMWKGDSISIETLRRWNDQPLTMAESAYPLTLKEVFDHHHAELWPHTDKHGTRLSGLRLFIPMVRSDGKTEDIRRVPLLPKG